RPPAPPTVTLPLITAEVMVIFPNAWMAPPSPAPPNPPSARKPPLPPAPPTAWLLVKVPETEPVPTPPAIAPPKPKPPNPPLPPCAPAPAVPPTALFWSKRRAAMPLSWPTCNGLPPPSTGANNAACGDNWFASEVPPSPARRSRGTHAALTLTHVASWLRQWDQMPLEQDRPRHAGPGGNPGSVSSLQRAIEAE